MQVKNIITIRNLFLSVLGSRGNSHRKSDMIFFQEFVLWRHFGSTDPWAMVSSVVNRTAGKILMKLLIELIMENFLVDYCCVLHDTRC